jgi:hypothetical protein
MKMKNKSNDEFIVAGVAGVTSIFILAMSWPEFKAVAEDHPTIRVFTLGLMLLFMAAANLSKGLQRRSWLKQMKTLGSTTTESTLSSEGAPSEER